MGLNINPYSNTHIKNLEYIQNKALVIAPFEITKSGKLDPDLMLDTPGTITMYFFRKTFNDIDKEPTAEQFKTVGNVADISAKLGLDIASSNISSSASSSYYLGFTEISVIFKYDKNTGIRTIEKNNSLLQEDYIDIGIDNTCNLTAEDYFVICNVTKNTKATNTSFTDTTGMDFLFMIPSGECQEIITDFDILDANNKTINIKKYGTLGSGFVIDNDTIIETTIEPAYEADFFGDGSNIATYLFDGTCEDLNGNYNGTATDITYGEGKVGQAVNISSSSNIVIPNGGLLPFNTTNFAISFWYKPTSFANTNQTIFGTYKGGSWTTNEWQFGPTHPWSGNKFSLAVYNINSRAMTLVSNTTTVLNTIYHVVITRNNGIIALYINGILDNSITINNAILFDNRSNNLPFYLGGPTPTTNCLGDLDQVRIFNRALNQNEVTALYLNNGSTRVIKQESNVVNNNWTQIQLETVEPLNPTIPLDLALPTPVIKIKDPKRKDFFGDKSMVACYQFDDTLSFSNVKKIVMSNFVEPKQYTYMDFFFYTGFTHSTRILPANYVQTGLTDNSKNWFTNIQDSYYNPRISDIEITFNEVIPCIYSAGFGVSSWIANNGTNGFKITAYDVNGNIVGQKTLTGLLSGAVTSNMVRYYPLDLYPAGLNAPISLAASANGVGIIADETGFYNGTLSGSNFTFTSGKFGQCVSVNSTNYVNLPETLSTIFGTNDFSISLWFKPSGTFVTNNIIFATQSSNSSGFFSLLINSNKIWVGLFNGSSRPSIAHQDNINLTDWNHVVVTKESNIYKIYSNNVVSSTTLTDALSIKCGDIRIGQNPAAPSLEYFNGQIDNVKIFNRALTDSEVTSLYDETISPIITLETETETIASEPDFFNDKSNIATYLFDNYNETDVLNLLGEDFSDVTGKAITNNGVTIDTTNKASGSGSYKFSNNSYISLPTSNDFAFGTGDFTIECDFYLITFNINGAIILEGRPDNTNGTYITFGLDGAGKFGIFSNGVQILTSNATLVTNKWYHLSCKRRNGIFTLLIDGVLDATSGATSINFTRNTFVIGKNAFSSKINTTWIGNIDNIKLSRLTILDANDKYNGTATNITYTDGKFGKCANFDGTSKISSDINLNSNNFSISFWGNLSNIQSTHSFILSTINGDNKYGIRMTNFGKLEPNIWTGVDNVFGVDANWSNYANTWTNYVFSIANNTCYFYINGELKTTKTFTNNVIFNGVNIGYGQGGIYNIVGQIDNVRIFNRALTASEVQDLYRETKRVKYKAITLDANSFGSAAKFNIETQKEIKLLNYKTWTGTDATSQGYRIYPVMNISDHTTEETTFNPKYYLGTKYQRNLSEILSQGIKSKRTISNLKDMYLVDDLCIQTLKKINILLETDQMIKFSERLYNLAIPLREKLNADLILEYLSTPVSGSSNSDIADILKTSLMEDYNFTQDEIDNLNDNLNTFKSRARIALNAPVIQGSGLDQLRFNLPKTFIDNNRSKTEKKNLLVFGTDAGFNKFNLAGYTAPYSNISKREESLDYTSLVAGLPNMSSKYSKPVVDDKTFMMYSGSLTDATGKRPTLTGGSLSTTTKKFNDSSIYINNSFITIPAGANLSIGTKDFTVETWINPTSIADVYIFTLGLNQHQCCFAVKLSTGAVLFRAGSGGWSWDFASDRITASNLVKANTWNHIVTQRRNGNLEIYINGILYYTGVWAYNIPNGTNLYIGGYVGGSNITAYYDDISISNGVGRYTSNFIFEMSDGFKDILTNYKQQIPFTYIPLSTDIKDINDKPVFETLTDITGFYKSEIIIDIPNVL